MTEEAMTGRNAKMKMRGVTVLPVELDSPLSPENEYESPGKFVYSAIETNGVTLEENDVVVVTSKIVSILERRCFELDKVRPSFRAKLLGKVFKKEPQKVELILKEGPISAVLPFKWVLKDKRIRERILGSSLNETDSLEIVDSFKSVFLVKRYGIYLDEAGIDCSNLPDGWAGLLPADPCKSARKMREEFEVTTGKQVAVVITDTMSVLGRTGSNDIALGFSGIDPLTREHARPDLFGKPESGGMDIIVDSISAFAGSVMGGFDECSPISVVKGLRYRRPTEDFGIEALTYPPGASFRSFLKAILPNILFRLILLVTLPFAALRHPRKH